MHIAICDDEEVFLHAAEALIKQDVTAKHEVSFFRSGEELAAVYQEGRANFDLLFLDIEMKQLDGLATAEYIRRHDMQVMIVFLTAHGEFVTCGYDVEAIGFLTKPIDEQKFMKTFERCQNHYQKRHKAISFKIFDESGNCLIKTLAVQDIVYLYMVNKKDNGRFVNIYLLNGKCYRLAKGIRLSEVEKQLKAYNFYRCEQGVLVNLAYIQDTAADKSAITLRPPYDKVKLVVTRRYKQEFFTHLTIYLAGGHI